MEEQVRRVAARVRELREIAGVSADRLARELKISEQEYLAFEDGGADIPLGVLCAVAARFGVELSSILTGEEPRLRVYSVVRAGKGPSVERRTEHRYESLAPNFAHKRAEPFLVTVDPAPPGGGARPGSHPGQEFHYLLAGDLAVHVGGHDVLLHPGDSLYFDAAVPHTLRAAGPASARVLVVVL